MEKNDPKKIIKILVIIGIILTAISILLPWAVFSYSITFFSEKATVSADFYPWALHAKMEISYKIIGQTSLIRQEVWSMFYSKDMVISDPDLQNFISNIYLFSEETQASATVAFLICFILCIFTIILGLFATTRKNICLTAGITSLIAIIAFISSITILLTSDSSGLLSQKTSYSLGLFLIICAMIIFFITYILHILLPKMALDKIVPQAYPTYTPPPQIFKQNDKISSSYPTSPAARNICPKCGISLYDNPEFCSNCGAKLR